MTHELKIHPEHYAAVHAGTKTFELRLNDRNFQVGDRILLAEYIPKDFFVWSSYNERYTHNKILVSINYILNGPCYGLAAGYVIMSFTKL